MRKIEINQIICKIQHIVFICVFSDISFFAYQPRYVYVIYIMTCNNRNYDYGFPVSIDEKVEDDIRKLVYQCGTL